MGARDGFAFAIGDILDKLERAAREVGKSLDHKNRVDVKRLRQVRESLSAALGELDALVDAAEETTK